MKKLDKRELNNISGGGIATKTVCLIIGGIAAFVIGVIDGFTRPLKCNK